MAKNTLQYFTDPLINGQSMAASFNGTPTNFQFFDNLTFQLSWTGASPAGTIGIQVSNNFDSRFPNNATWSDLQDPPGTPVTIIPDGSAGNGVFDLNQLGGMWVRIVYTTTGGSVGSLTSTLTAKGLQ